MVLPTIVKTAYAKRPNTFTMRLQRPYGLCLVQITTPTHHRTGRMATATRLALDPKHRLMSAAASFHQRLLRIRTHSSRLNRLWGQYQKEWRLPVNSHLYRRPFRTLR